MNGYAHYCFGFEMVLLIASRGHRVPVAICAMDPHRKGQQNIIFRRMLRKYVPPGWAGAVVVEADAEFAANRTIKLINKKKYGYVFAMSRTRKFRDGKVIGLAETRQNIEQITSGDCEARPAHRRHHSKSFTHA
jgi:hypothetical protein